MAAPATIMMYSGTLRPVSRIPLGEAIQIYDNLQKHLRVTLNTSVLLYSSKICLIFDKAMFFSKVCSLQTIALIIHCIFDKIPSPLLVMIMRQQ